MRIKKLVELYMNPIDIIEIYDKNRNLLYTVDVYRDSAAFESVANYKVDLFDIYAKEEITVLEIIIKQR